MKIHHKPTYFGKWLRDEYKSVGDLVIAMLTPWQEGMIEIQRADKDFYLLRKINSSNKIIIRMSKFSIDRIIFLSLMFLFQTNFSSHLKLYGIW